MKTILIGTTNPSKIKRFEQILEGYDVKFLTLNDLNITNEPTENGNTPQDNALIKARYYSKFYSCVICSDSGLYFNDLDINDPRQPGLHIRTPNGKERLNDEQMIEYYSSLVQSLGGKIKAHYLDAIAVFNNGKIDCFIEEDLAKELSPFYMVSKVNSLRNPGWPLDSISINEDGSYFVSRRGHDVAVKKNVVKENVFTGIYYRKLKEFLVKTLDLE